jgi:hypothetical protein
MVGCTHHHDGIPGINLPITDHDRISIIIINLRMTRMGRSQRNVIFHAVLLVLLTPFTAKFHILIIVAIDRRPENDSSSLFKVLSQHVSRHRHP